MSNSYSAAYAIYPGKVASPAWRAILHRPPGLMQAFAKLRNPAVSGQGARVRAGISLATVRSGRFESRRGREASVGRHVGARRRPRRRATGSQNQTDANASPCREGAAFTQSAVQTSRPLRRSERPAAVARHEEELDRCDRALRGPRDPLAGMDQHLDRQGPQPNPQRFGCASRRSGGTVSRFINTSTLCVLITNRYYAAFAPNRPLGSTPAPNSFLVMS